MLGPEYGSLKSLFSLPIHLSRVIRVKSTSLNLIVASLIAETFLIGLIAGTVVLDVLQLATIVLYSIALIIVWDVLGSYCSITLVIAIGYLVNCSKKKAAAIGISYWVFTVAIQVAIAALGSYTAAGAR